MSWLLLWMVLTLTTTTTVVRAEFGDYADFTFECPARTTCPVICVVSKQYCPTSCADAGDVLCGDGTCAPVCSAEQQDPANNPCQHKCAPTACFRPVRYHDQCLESYGEFYDYQETCKQEEYQKLLNGPETYRYPHVALVTILVWVLSITLANFLWCFYNQKVSPIAGSSQALAMDQKAAGIPPAGGGGGGGGNHNTNIICMQTGYKYHPVGQVLYYCTMVTYFGFSLALAWLTIEYYVLQYHQKTNYVNLYEEEGNTHNHVTDVHFSDEVELLRVWIAIWNLGLVWCFFMKWPYTMQSIFLRRCELYQATHVGVFLETATNTDTTTTTKKNESATASTTKLVVAHPIVRWFQSTFASAGIVMNKVMSVLFSDVDAYHVRTAHGGIYELCEIKKDGHGGGHSYFLFLFRRYNMDPETKSYRPGFVVIGESLQDMIQYYQNTLAKGGLSLNDIQDRYRNVGPNKIEMPEPKLYQVIVGELSKPFYTYQLFMVWSWTPLYYFYMAIVWAIIMLTSALTVALFQFRTLQTLHKITHVEGTTQVLRNSGVGGGNSSGVYESVDQATLVPGDLIKLQPGPVYCDMILVAGDTTVVDESALTGESNPQPKAALEETSGGNNNEPYNPHIHKRHTIAAGTTVLEVSSKEEEDDAGAAADKSSSSGGGASIAMVLQTGSYTTKGELLREIFSYERHSFKFDEEVTVVVGILVLYSALGFLLACALIEDQPVYKWFFAIYVVSAVIPPLLPTVFTVSVFTSDKRLSRRRIATVNPESILIAGKVTRAFFDKTGTLTKQGLDFLSADKAMNAGSSESEKHLSLAMATCHSLTLSQKATLASPLAAKGAPVLLGNPVDRTMFLASGWTLHEHKAHTTLITDVNGNQLEVVRHFDFDHHRMTQSVVVKLQNGTHVAFVKGSGESIQKLCNSSTLPTDFETKLADSARSGVYQISVAMKFIPEGNPVGSLNRDEVEQNLDFCGFLNFKNILREETKDVIQELADGEVRSIMVTGDSVLTGVRMAIESGIFCPQKQVIIGTTNNSDELVWSSESGDVITLPPLQDISDGAYEVALSGKAWNVLEQQDQSLSNLLLPHIRVFGRCTPYDKVAVVNRFVEQGFVTLMCGDGGNDSGALKAAHVGIALSDAEASMVAPFTSLDKDIVSVLDVLKEGRCALASALATYKYIICYGELSVINIMVNAANQVTFSEWCWVFIDGIWTVTLGFALPLAKPAPVLSNTRPTASILGPHTMASVMGVLIIHLLFTIFAMVMLYNQDWYQCRMWEENDVSNVVVIGDNYEAEVLFLITGYQFITSAMAYNFGYEFRGGWCTNYWFVGLISGYTFLHFFVLLTSNKVSCLFRVNCVNENVLVGVTANKLPIQNPYNTTVMPDAFRWKLLILIILNTAAVMGYEYFVVNGLRRKWGIERRQKAALGSDGKGVGGGDLELTTTTTPPPSTNHTTTDSEII